MNIRPGTPGRLLPTLGQLTDSWLMGAAMGRAIRFTQKEAGFRLQQFRQPRVYAQAKNQLTEALQQTSLGQASLRMMNAPHQPIHMFFTQGNRRGWRDGGYVTLGEHGTHRGQHLITLNLREGQQPLDKLTEVWGHEVLGHANASQQQNLSLGARLKHRLNLAPIQGDTNGATLAKRVRHLLGFKGSNSVEEELASEYLGRRLFYQYRDAVVDPFWLRWLKRLFSPLTNHLQHQRARQDAEDWMRRTLPAYRHNNPLKRFLLGDFNALNGASHRMAQGLQQQGVTDVDLSWVAPRAQHLWAEPPRQQNDLASAIASMF
jgi:hypothetical protein